MDQWVTDWYVKYLQSKNAGAVWTGLFITHFCWSKILVWFITSSFYFKCWWLMCHITPYNPYLFISMVFVQCSCLLLQVEADLYDKRNHTNADRTEALCHFFISFFPCVFFLALLKEPGNETFILLWFLLIFSCNCILCHLMFTSFDRVPSRWQETFSCSFSGSSFRFGLLLEKVYIHQYSKKFSHTVNCRSTVSLLCLKCSELLSLQGPLSRTPSLLWLVRSHTPEWPIRQVCLA